MSNILARGILFSSVEHCDISISFQIPHKLIYSKFIFARGFKDMWGAEYSPMTTFDPLKHNSSHDSHVISLLGCQFYLLPAGYDAIRVWLPRFTELRVDHCVCVCVCVCVCFCVSVEIQWLDFETSADCESTIVTVNGELTVLCRFIMSQYFWC